MVVVAAVAAAVAAAVELVGQALPGCSQPQFHFPRVAQKPPPLGQVPSRGQAVQPCFSSALVARFELELTDPVKHTGK